MFYKHLVSSDGHPYKPGSSTHKNGRGWADNALYFAHSIRHMQKLIVNLTWNKQNEGIGS
jgi:hypothetical protein